MQGQDYAYTLHGWLKAINGFWTAGEIGMDGTAAAPNQFVAKDAYNLILHYNQQDYKPILSVCFCVNDQLTVTGAMLRNLYNGNIMGMSVYLPKVNYPISTPGYQGAMYYNYKYDQINRITGMDAYSQSAASLHALSYHMALNDYKERVSYDGNGNILKYLRNGTTLNSRPLNMDSLGYKYYAGTNRLRQVRDSVNAADYTEDIDNQSDTSNYVYDAIGNLIQDKAEGIDSVKWNVYGKISNIYKSSGLKIGYTYDAGGNRVSKKVINGTDTTITWYVRDATRNVMSTYVVKNDTATQDEIHLYGSSRIGILKPGRILTLDEQYGDTTGTLTLLGIWNGNVFRRGQKFFELANHLGNVLVTISDKKLGIDTNADSIVNYYTADVMTANDYYPFGMGMPERKFAATDLYRYGFNGKENDNEVKGEGNQQDYGMRIYDPRVARFLTVDPIQASYPELTPYQFASNRSIDGIDLDGLEHVRYGGATIVHDNIPRVSHVGVTDESGLRAVIPILPTKEKAKQIEEQRPPPIKLGDGSKGFRFYQSNSLEYHVSMINQRDAEIAWHEARREEARKFKNIAKKAGSTLKDIVESPFKEFDEFKSSINKGDFGGTLKHGFNFTLSAAPAYGVFKLARPLSVTTDKVKYIGRLEDLKGIPRSQTLLGDLPNLGNPKENYYQNMSVIRKALRNGYTIKDASWFRPNSELAPTSLNPNRTVGQTFLGAERLLLQNRGLWPQKTN